MHLLYIVVVLSLMLVVSPIPAALPQKIVATEPVVELHYIKGGVIEINRHTGATRFTPYRYAGDLDRRRDRVAA